MGGLVLPAVNYNAIEGYVADWKKLGKLRSYLNISGFCVIFFFFFWNA